MPLETITFTSDLNPANPPATDGLVQGDDHLRGIKAALKNTFVNFTAAALNSTQAAIDAVVSMVTTGPIVVPSAGTAAAPAIQGTGDPDTGIYFPAANTVGVAVGGVEALELSSAGVNMKEGGLLRAGTAVFPVQTADIGDLQVTGGKVAANTITLDKLPAATGKSLLGAAAAGTYSPLTVGAGLDVSGGALVATAIPAGFISRDLSITNDATAPNTKININCFEAVLVDNTTFAAVKHHSVAVSVDFTTTGAGGCDIGTRAASKGYNIFLISNGATCAGIAVLDTAGSISMPTGYNFIKFVGWFPTDASSNLRRLKQTGNQVQYVKQAGVGLPIVAQNITSSGSVSAPVYAAVSLVGLVAPVAVTAGFILLPSINGAGVQHIALAPNANYGAVVSANCPPGVAGIDDDMTFTEFLLESTSVYVWAGNSNCGITLFSFTLPV